MDERTLELRPPGAALEPQKPKSSGRRFLLPGALGLASFFLLLNVFQGLLKDDPEPVLIEDYSDCVAADGTVSGSVPQSCSYNDKVWTEPLIVACQRVDHEHTDCVKPKTPAEEAGEKAGETYNDLKDAGRDFLKGFDSATN